MIPQTTGAQGSEFVYQNQPEGISFKWLEQLSNITRTKHFIHESHIELFTLNDTLIGFTNGFKDQNMESRVAYVKEVIVDICRNCPKDQDLTLVSLGSDHLLIEYLVAVGLFENGFTNLSIFLIDPIYRSSILPQQHFKKLKDQFREQIILKYFDLGYGLIPFDKIRYFSRGQNIEKYFAKNSNVVVLESLPPYFALTQDHFASIPTPSQDMLFSGSFVVNKENANGIIFYPSARTKELESFPSFPLKLMSDINLNYCIDMGCRIYSDGRYAVNLHGFDSYLNVFQPGKISLSNGETRSISQGIEEIKDHLKNFIKSQIESLKKHDQPLCLSQEQTTLILDNVVKRIKTLQLGWKTFFIADYNVDRSETFDFLSKNAGHHYRKGFALLPDPHKKYRITAFDL